MHSNFIKCLFEKLFVKKSMKELEHIIYLFIYFYKRFKDFWKVRKQSIYNKNSFLFLFIFYYFALIFIIARKYIFYLFWSTSWIFYFGIFSLNLNVFSVHFSMITQHSKIIWNTKNKLFIAHFQFTRKKCISPFPFPLWGRKTHPSLICIFKILFYT